MNYLDLTEPNIPQLNETPLANVHLYGDSKKSTSENSKIFQRTIKCKNNLMNHSSYGHTYMHALYHIYTSCILTTYNMLNYHKCLSIKSMKLGNTISILLSLVISIAI